MSFAHKPKRAKPRTSSPKATRRPPIQPIDKLDLLEKAVINLQRETESLNVLTTLIERIPEFTSADTEAASIHTRLTTLEATTNARYKSIGDVQVTEPVSEDGIGANFKDVQVAINKAEEDSQVFGLDEKLILKSGEITCKQGYIKHIRDSAELVQKFRSEYEFLLTDFQVSVTAEASGSKDRVSSLQTKEELQREELTRAIVETQIVEKPSKKSKNKLIEELTKAAERSMKDVKAEIEGKMRLLELDFRQESILLRLDFDANALLRTAKYPEGDMTPEAAETLKTASMSALSVIDSQIEASFSGLKDVTSGLTDAITDTESRLTAFISTYGQALPIEQPVLLHIAQGDFERRLKGLMEAVGRLRQSVAVRESIICGEVFDAVMWGSCGEDCTEVVTVAGKLRTRLQATSQSLQSELDPSMTRLSALHTRATSEASLSLTPLIPPKDEKPSVKPMK